MKKILHYGIGKNLGGIETYLQKIAEHIDNDKYKFDYLIQGDEVAPGFEKARSNGSNFYFVTPRSSNPIKNSKEVKKIIIENNYSIIHNHLLSLSYVAPVFHGLKYNIPTIIHSHSSSAPNSLLTHSLHLLNKQRLKKKKYHALSVSDKASDWMFTKNENVTVINNGIDTNKYVFKEEARLRIRKEFNMLNEFIMIHVGTLKEVKNHKFILEVFSEFKRRVPKSKLILVGGNGDLREEINEKVETLNLKDSVIFTGIRTDISSLLSAADVLIFPSFYEGFPGVVIEAQTSGLPCVISDRITSDVVVNDNCIQLPLELPASHWAETIVDIEHFNNRQVGVQNINKFGLSVEEEITQLQEFYRDILEN